MPEGTSNTALTHTIHLDWRCIIDTLSHSKTIRKSFKYRLYPNKAQEAKIQWTLERCCELYNAALTERRDAYNFHVKQHPNYYDEPTRKQLTKELHIDYLEQQNQVPEIRQIREEYQDISSMVLQNVCRRVDLAFRAFIRRLKAGEKPGFPRYKSRRRYDSFTYGDATVIHVKDRTVRLPKFGEVRIKVHTPLLGIPKTCTVKREGEHWYVVFSCILPQPDPLTVSYEDVGIDLGVLHLATLSTGEVIDHPQFLRKSEKRLKTLQQSRDRKKRGSKRRQKANKAVAKVHRKIARQRRDFLHKESRKLVNRFQVIVFEDLQTANLTKRPKTKRDEETGEYLPNKANAKAGLNKSILDAGWAMFVEMCSYKAESAGRTLLQVNPRYTSQICSGCGSIVKKELSERWHSCSCGTELDRDHNAAINILKAGRQPTEQSVEG